MSRLKFLSPLIGLAGGIFISSEFSSGYFLPLIFIGLSLLIWLSIRVISKDPVKGMKMSQMHHLWVILLFTGIGGLDFHFSSEPFIGKNIDNERVFATGEIKSVNTFTSGDQFVVQIIELKNSSGEKITCRNIALLLKTDGYIGNKGDIISFPVNLKALNSSPIAESYKSHLKHIGVSFTGNVKEINIYKLGESSGLANWFERLRENQIIKIDKSSVNPDTGNFLISVLLGDKSFLSEETKSNLNSSGLAHVLALSGMHVAIILSIILILLFPLSLLGLHKWRKILGILLIWVYVLFTGGSPSTIRAAIMATFLLTALILERKNSALNSLLAAVFFILIFDPIALFDIGLQLSFLCVASILLFIKKVNPVNQHHHPRIYKVINLFLLSLITTFCTWSFIGYYFGNISLMFLPANVFLLPLFPVFISSGILYLALLNFGIDFYFLSGVIKGFLDIFLKLSTTINLNGQSVVHPEIPGISVVLWLSAVLLLGFFFNSGLKRKKQLYLYSSLPLFLLSFLFMINLNMGKDLRLKFTHSFTKIEAQFSDNGLISKLEFPRNNISEAQHRTFQIISIDNTVHQDSIENFKFSTSQSKFLLVGPESDTPQIAELINETDFKKVILHPGVGKNKKAELFHLIEESNWDKIYSLGDNGSLEFLL